MAGIKEIRTRIKSVEQTLKITNAMYLISSANLRKAKGRLDNTVPYFTKIFKTIAHILHHSPELEHDFFDQRPDVEPQARKVGYIVVTGDKGLAGAYSHNVLKLAQQRVEEEKNLSLFLVGIVGRVYCQNRDIPFVEDFNYVAQNPTMRRAGEITDEVVARFLSRELDEVYIIYTEMVSALRLEVREQKLLPLVREDFPWDKEDEPEYRQEIRYIPSEEAVLDNIVPNYIQGMIFGSLVESYCSEQSARMTAMESASDNAKDMLKKLSLTYHRARQAAITQEITEVAGGARNAR